MTDSERAYIAGFLDGDGSIILQIVQRRDYKLGFQIRASVSFYQKRSNAAVLAWLKSRIGSGSIRHRGVMADYTVVGFLAVTQVLRLVHPFVIVKRANVEAALQIIAAAERIRNSANLLTVARAVDRYSILNYSKRRIITSDQVLRRQYVEVAAVSP